MTRMSTASVKPRNQPAVIPTRPPTRTVPAPASSATSTDTRVPRINWLRTSWPSRFVPSTYFEPGCWSDGPASAVAR